MRFRIKCNGQTSKLEISGTSCSLGQLKAAVVARLFPDDPEAVRALQLSFNNKDTITGEDAADVKVLGIASGDLLWVLSPQCSAPQPAAPEPKRAKESGPQTATLESAAGPSAGRAASEAGLDGLAATTAAASVARAGAQADAGGPASSSRPCGEALGDQAQAININIDGLPALIEAADAETASTAAMHAVPSYLLRALAHSMAASPEARSGLLTISTPAHVLLLAAHACMLESGFEPAWVAVGEPAAAGGASQGTEGPAAVPGLASSSPYSLPTSAQTSGSVFKLSYRLPALQQPPQPQSKPADGASSGHQAAGTSGAQGRACCTLQCSTLGPTTAMLVASTPRGHTSTLPLQATSYMEAAGMEQGPAPQTAGAGPSFAHVSATPAGGAALAAIAAATPAGPGPGAAGWDGQHIWVLNGEWCMGAEGVRRLWRALKDGLAFPMLLAAYADAGLPPPAGLLALPEDIKLAILGELNALQLGALSSCCAELRHLASQDSLWRPLLEAEFPSASAFYASQAARRGYKWAFGACWRDRRQREEAARRQRRLMPAIPNLGPRPPFYPPPSRFGVPGITGGDYDRLPAPFLGAGPGMFRGGGGLGGMGGGSMFGGSTGRRGGGGGSFRLS